MPSYVIVGASRGIGFALFEQLSADKDNTVVGLVRSVAAAKAKFASEFPDRKNIHVVHGDLNDRKTLEAAANEVASITGGAVDVFIANAAIGSDVSLPLTEEATKNPDRFEKDMIDIFRANVLGTIQAVAYFAPLVAKSALKKIAVLSTALGDVGVTLQTGVEAGTPYSVSKAAVNLAVAKFHLELRGRGVAVFAVSPGLVDTEFASDPNAPPLSEAEQAAKTAQTIAMVQKFKAYAPHWEPKALTPAESARHVLDVIAAATIEKNGGIMVSHFGTQMYL